MHLYEELTRWYHLVDPADDHAPEADGYGALFERVLPGAATLLELGSGAGNNASHLKTRYVCTLTDLSEAMLALSRKLNPECGHHRGDMRTLRLGRTFDVVLIHDAIMYMTTRDDLLAAAKTAAAHLRPGGAAIFAPDCLRESLVEQVEEVGEGDLRGLMWTWDPDPADETYRVDFTFMVREGREMRVVHDRHLEGVFGREVWVETLRRAGFSEVEYVAPGPGGRPGDVFLVRR
ncbi:MAG: class I SAM-dependent methyltransferase [Archangiaceae bacterium]|nr:class I SAM-dependent methyltransferase [Archangiaceae bacterium]